jgi:hypothetical protein
MIGASPRREYDLRQLTGGGRLLDDLTRAGLVHLGVVRSAEAHACPVPKSFVVRRAAAPARSVGARTLRPGRWDVALAHREQQASEGLEIGIGDQAAHLVEARALLYRHPWTGAGVVRATPGCRLAHDRVIR